MYYKNKFLGSRQIAEVKEIKFDEKQAEVIFTNGEKLTITEWVLLRAATDEAVDENTYRNKRVFPVVEAVLELFRETGLFLGDYATFENRLRWSVEDGVKKASDILWGNQVEERNIIQADKIIRDNESDSKIQG